MARIRSIHPGLSTDERFMSMSLAGKAAWPLLWTECDDHGVFEWKPIVLKARLLPADAVDFEELLGEWLADGSVGKFQQDGKWYGAVRNFCRYQRPKKPAYRFPLPDDTRTFVGLTKPITEPVPHRSPTSGEKPPQMKEEGGRRKEVERSLRDLSAARANEYDLLESQLREAAGLEDDPSPGLLVLRPVYDLLEAGYDLQRDILPFLRESKARGKRASTWGYYAKGIEGRKAQSSPVRPLAKVVAAVEWVPDVDARWRVLAERYRREHGKDPPKTAGAGGMGRHFPKDWVDDRVEIPDELRRTANA